MRLAFVAALLLLTPALARAQDGDGAYGRLSADVVLSAAVGGAVRFDTGTHGAVLAELRARYLDVAGLVLAPEWRVGEDARVVLAADVRPIFLARFFLNRETRLEWLDLLIDSLGFELGVAVTPLGARTGAGFALTLGGGLDVPLYRDGTTRVGLRLAVRWVRAAANERLGPEGGAEDLSVLSALVVSFGVGAGVVTREPSLEYRN